MAYTRSLFRPNRIRRRGFTLAEVAVAAAIVALLAAVSAPYFVAFLDKQRAQTTADKLSALATGIAAFANAVKTTTGVATATTYPGLISELANQISLNSTVSHNSCGSAATGTFNASAVTTGWGSNGPFVNFYIPVGGLMTPLGTVADSMVRNPASATVGTLAIQLLSVDTADANLLDLLVDGTSSATAGTVRLSNVTNGKADVSYLVPVGPRC